MKVRARRACWLILLAIGCSDGTAPALPPNGLFTAGLTGARNLQLVGTASAGLIFIETGTEYSVRMFDSHLGELRGVSIRCPGEAVPAVGLHELGPGADCQGRYTRAIPSPDIGLVFAEVAVADAGSFTVTKATDEELGGRFTFHGELVVGTDSMGSVTVTGTFRAVPQP